MLKELRAVQQWEAQEPPPAVDQHSADYSEESRASSSISQGQAPLPLRNLQTSADAVIKKRASQVRFINYEPAQKFEIYQVARAATAAPLYFDPLKIRIEGYESIHAVYRWRVRLYE